MTPPGEPGTGASTPPTSDGTTVPEKTGMKDDPGNNTPPAIETVTDDADD